MQAIWETTTCAPSKEFPDGLRTEKTMYKQGSFGEWMFWRARGNFYAGPDLYFEIYPSYGNTSIKAVEDWIERRNKVCEQYGYDQDSYELARITLFKMEQLERLAETDPEAAEKQRWGYVLK